MEHDRVWLTVPRHTVTKVKERDSVVLAAAAATLVDGAPKAKL